MINLKLLSVSVFVTVAVISELSLPEREISKLCTHVLFY